MKKIQAVINAFISAMAISDAGNPKVSVIGLFFTGSIGVHLTQVL